MLLRVSTVLSLLVCLALCTASFAQPCSSGEVEVSVVIQTDNYGYETGWKLLDATTLTVYYEVPVGALASNTLYSTDLCVPDSSCLQLSIIDDFGDGIYAPGGYIVALDGVSAAAGTVSGMGEEIYVNCGPGQSCGTAIVVTPGSYTAVQANSWYSFTPDSVGTYKISTCGSTPCDTRLWMYDDCDGIDLLADEAGAYYYNDNSTACGLLAEIENAILAPATSYLIRVGDVGGDCGGSAIDWSLSYNGPVVGCMDSTACTFEPLATIPGDTCIYPPSADCPDGPDLIIDQGPLVTSMYMTTYSVSDACLVAEECVTGYGSRTLIRFATHIRNIGNLDYYIGSPSANPDQFDFLNCHGHAHYKGYAEYLLYDQAGNETPVGFKNGFCVMDITCSPGSSPTYGCGTMGITAGCADIYGAGTTCNWIDVTDIDTGTYTFVARTNWDQSPDGLGRHEVNYTNNWTQVCLYVGENALGRYFSIDTVCDPYVDCAGEIYGSAQPDCNGDCNGTELMGDLDANGSQEIPDVQKYVSDILGDDIVSNSCNDLNDDGEITVSDAALLNSCLLFSAGHPHPGGGASHDHCDFPQALENPFDTVWLSIQAIDFDSGWVDIGIRNPYNRVVAYQFEVEGIEIMSVESLGGADFPASADGSLGGHQVVGLSYVDSSLDKSTNIQALCRVRWASITGTEICVSQVVDVINTLYEEVIVGTEDACRPVETTSGIAEGFNPLNARVIPNPASGTALLHFYNPESDSYRFELFDTRGVLLRQLESVRTGTLPIDAASLAPGLYHYRLSGQRQVSGSFLVH